MIAWKYLDKQRATLNVLSDYINMETVIVITPNEIKSLANKAEGPRNSVSDGLPHTRNIRYGENLLCNVIDQCDVLYNRYQQALEFMSWFTPAWLQLSDAERALLDAFYLCGDDKVNAVDILSEQLHIERAQIYRRKDKALNHLAVLLYGA